MKHEAGLSNSRHFSILSAKKMRGLAGRITYHPGFGAGTPTIRAGKLGNMIEIMGKKIETPKPAAAIAEPSAIKKTTSPAIEPAGSAAVARGGTPATAPVKKKSTPKPKPAASKTAKAKPVTYSQEDVALRAYFIAEDRNRKGLPGDSRSDWLEAERQLRAEQKKKSAKKPSVSKKRG